ncbi:F-box only protein 43-like [Diaphorina citri]|uniref:F-box only protein 43-like n=1 Tax=Diaphorina citri TaxID=121845 RepID=A0A3Q0JCR3_DIACI|nr:F-box only protein 43-like [Diaphorina citri]
MSSHHADTRTPQACSGLLARLHRKAASSYEEQDSGYCTPGSAFLSFSPDAETPTRSEKLQDRLEDRVDLLTELGGAHDYFPVLSKIFAYLSDEDVASASRVSKSWNRVVNANVMVRHRLRDYLNRKISNAENEQELNDKTNRLLSNQRPALDAPSNKGLRLLNNITNVHSNQTSQRTSAPREIQSHTVFNLFRQVRFQLSRFNEFFLESKEIEYIVQAGGHRRSQHIFSPQEGEKLSKDESLQRCTRCKLPAKVNKTNSMAQCVNKGCEYVFCTSCLGEYSIEPAHSCILLPPTTPRSKRKYFTVGSKANRANLKRLLR